VSRQERRQEFEGGGVNASKGGGAITVKTLKFEKRCPPPASMVVPPLILTTIFHSHFKD